MLTKAWFIDGVKTSYAQSDAALTAMKKEPDLAFLNEVSSVPLQQTLRHQHKAFVALWEHRSEYPTRKTFNGRQSASFTRSAFIWRDGQLTLAKMKTPMSFVWTWPDIDPATLNPSTVTVSHGADGRWFISFACDLADRLPLPVTGKIVGVDLGLKDFAVLSTGERIPHPHHMEHRERRLKMYQRRKARKVKGSANRRKAKMKESRQYSKVTDARADFLHKASTDLVERFDVIAIEDLAPKNMVKNRRLSKAISRVGWGEFRRQLTYKCERAGRSLIVIDRWYPSSKTCSACGHLLNELSLGTRHWTCPGCGTLHDRDLNAARNILAAGLAVGARKDTRACGGAVRPTAATSRRVPVKQEPAKVTS